MPGNAPEFAAESPKPRLVIIGAGEFAEIAFEYFTQDSPYEVVGFAVEREFLTQTKLFDLPVVPFEEVETHFPPGEHTAFVAVTFTQLNRVRTKLYHLAKSKGYKLATYISSRAFVWHNAQLGDNCFVFENNVIQYHVKIGNNVIMWSGNHVGHRTEIGDHTFISSHVVISGYCHIGQRCFFGVNSTFHDNIKVGDDCVVAAGALVAKSMADKAVLRTAKSELSNIDSLTLFKLSNADSN